LQGRFLAALTFLSSVENGGGVLVQVEWVRSEYLLYFDVHRKEVSGREITWLSFRVDIAHGMADNITRNASFFGIKRRSPSYNFHFCQSQDISFQRPKAAKQHGRGVCVDNFLTAQRELL
jgi:hypothetical protein